MHPKHTTRGRAAQRPAVVRSAQNCCLMAHYRAMVRGITPQPRAAAQRGRAASIDGAQRGEVTPNAERWRAAQNVWGARCHKAQTDGARHTAQGGGAHSAEL
jgi:hypothetical protein